MHPSNDTCRVPREARAAERIPKRSLLDARPAGDRRVPLAPTLMSNLYARSQKAFSFTVLGRTAQSRFAVKSGVGISRISFRETQSPDFENTQRLMHVTTVATDV
jgi:hypothetical protein